MVRILIVDDHPAARAGMRLFIEKIPNLHELDDTCAQTALAGFESSSWDLVILDINLSDFPGLEILNDIRASSPGVKVLVVNSLPEEQYAIKTLKAGARGYITKECAAEQLRLAVVTLLRGGSYISDDFAQRLLSELCGDSTPSYTDLSDRERQVLFKLAAGQTVTAIGSDLCLSVKTISSYRTRILRKMRFVNNADMTIYVLRNETLQ